MSEPVFISAGELAETLDVGSGTVNRWARAGAIPSIELPNGRLVFDLAAVLAVLPRRGYERVPAEAGGEVGQAS